MLSGNRTRVTLAAGCVALTAAAVTACGSSGSKTAAASSPGSASSGQVANNSSSAGLAQLKLIGLPVVQIADVFAAQKYGFLKKEGISISFTPAETATAITASLSSGQDDIGVGVSAPTALIASGAGIPMNYFGPFDELNPNPALATQEIVALRSKISTAQGLAHATIGVPTIGGANEVAVVEMLKASGVPTKDVKFVVAPLPSVASELESGVLTAAFLSEPFLTEALEAHSNLARVPVTVTPVARLTPGTGFMVSPATLKKKTKLIADFQIAVTKGAEYLAQHPSATRALAATYTSVPAVTLQKIRLPYYVTRLPSSQFNQQMLQTTALGFEAKQVPLSQWLPGKPPGAPLTTLLTSAGQD